MSPSRPTRLVVDVNDLAVAIEILKSRYADDSDVEAHSFDDDEGQGITVTIVPTLPN